MADRRIGSSFRDPAGHVFVRDGVLHRFVAPGYAPHYQQLMDSGLYEALTSRGLLVSHEEVEPDAGWAEGARLLRPREVDFVSYPYEWCAGQLRDAALATLEVQRLALRHGMTLKDASAYNVQLDAGRPVLIDTLSFERYNEGAPWVAYRQFCEHFLAPLALMVHRDPRSGRWLRAHLDGVPLDLARRLLPARCWLDPQLLIHIRVHASYQQRYNAKSVDLARARGVSRNGLEGIVGGLAAAVRRLRPRAARGAWAGYTDERASYSEPAIEHKLERVAAHLAALRPGRVLDLGGNTGEFSRLACAAGATVLCCDADVACVERCWSELREDGARLLPLVMDLSNPSPSLGWAASEREPLHARAGADLVLALALLHHLAITHHLPFDRIAEHLAELAPHVLVEWIPKQDPMVEHMLGGREDVFDNYHREGFEAAFRRHFEVLASEPIAQSDRVLFLLRRRNC